MTTPLTADDAGDILHDYACEPEVMEAVGAQLAAIRDGNHICLARMTEAQVRAKFEAWFFARLDNVPTRYDCYLRALQDAGLLKDGL